ncbi:MAG TPA: DUF952 domain-containing protein [Pseudomonadota bacterium]|jgi:uncharacterized protein (DUF952 family)|nr:DUF952 domain-containing protein [Pseudomonadota bacterium]
MSIIYRILSQKQWEDALQAGQFDGSEHDLRDGFIHFSTASQVAETAAKYYAGLPDLLLLFVDTETLTAPLKWEEARNQQRFPHLYGPLLVSTVTQVVSLPILPDGRHVFPKELP